MLYLSEQHILCLWKKKINVFLQTKVQKNNLFCFSTYDILSTLCIYGINIILDKISKDIIVVDQHNIGYLNVSDDKKECMNVSDDKKE